jgi:urea transporter
MTFLGMYLDFYWQGREGLIGYKSVLAALLIITFFQKSTKQMLFLNLLSCLSSFVFNLFYLNGADYYFKPFSTNMLVVLESIGWLIPQYLIMGIKSIIKNLYLREH